MSDFNFQCIWNSTWGFQSLFLLLVHRIFCLCDFKPLKTNQLISITRKWPEETYYETVLWRQRRNIAELGKHDVEYTEGIFLGISGMSTELLVGTPKGVFWTRDVRALSDTPARWNREFVMKSNTPFQKYVDPSEQLPDQVIIEPGNIAHAAYVNFKLNCFFNFQVESRFCMQLSNQKPFAQLMFIFVYEYI